MGDLISLLHKKWTMNFKEGQGAQILWQGWSKKPNYQIWKWISLLLRIFNNWKSSARVSKQSDLLIGARREAFCQRWMVWKTLSMCEKGNSGNYSVFGARLCAGKQRCTNVSLLLNRSMSYVCDQLQLLPCFMSCMWVATITAVTV